MHDKGTKWNVDAIMNHPLARPLIALGRTLYVQTVTINSAQPDFDIEISNCSCSIMRGHCSSVLVSNKRRWTELCNNENYILQMIQFQWKNNCYFWFPFYWDALYSDAVLIPPSYALFHGMWMKRGNCIRHIFRAKIFSRFWTKWGNSQELNFAKIKPPQKLSRIK